MGACKVHRRSGSGDGVPGISLAGRHSGFQTRQWKCARVSRNDGSRIRPVGRVLSPCIAVLLFVRILLRHYKALQTYRHVRRRSPLTNASAVRWFNPPKNKLLQAAWPLCCLPTRYTNLHDLSLFVFMCARLVDTAVYGSFRQRKRC